MAGPPPPDALVRGLVEGPSLVSGLEWHDEVGSTNDLAVAAAARGVPEGHVVAADVQTAGRGRQGRGWVSPPGTSLLMSLVLRPQVPTAVLPLAPLLVGIALAEAIAPHCPEAEVALKWPNDLLAGGRKCAGILAQSSDGALIVGIGVNVDWRGVDRPAELGASTSLAEAVARDVDRWRVFAALVGVLGNRYRQWQAAPRAFLDDYRARCTTIGRRVHVDRPGAPALEGTALAVDEVGRLVIIGDDGTTERVSAGDVLHVRPAS